MATASGGEGSGMATSDSPSRMRAPEERDHGGTSSSGGAASESGLNAARLKEKKAKRKRAIKKLDKRLELLARQIRKFNEEELTLEDMSSGSSAYMREDLLKREFVHTWSNLCKLRKVPEQIVVEDESCLNFSGTQYPEINRRIQRLLLRSEFPDYVDMIDIVERCNAKHSLGIGAEEKAVLSRSLFKDVGRLLKKRRQRDFVHHFGSHLTDRGREEEDPALKDAEWVERLKVSARIAQEKMEQLCETFVARQETDFPEGAPSPPGDSCSENEVDEEEEGGEGEEEEARGGREENGEEEKEEGGGREENREEAGGGGEEEESGEMDLREVETEMDLGGGEGVDLDVEDDSEDEEKEELESESATPTSTTPPLASPSQQQRPKKRKLSPQPVPPSKRPADTTGHPEAILLDSDDDIIILD